MSFTTTLRNILARAAIACVLPLPGLLSQTATVYGTGCFGMSLATDEVPDVGTAPFNFLVSGIPTGSVINALYWNFAATPGPLDLAFLGAPGCFLHVSAPVLYAVNLFPIGTTDSFTSAGTPPIYNAVWWVNVASFFQAASLVPGINACGLATSNGVALVGG